MNKAILLIVQLLFICYYAYVIFVFYKRLHKNTCKCEKLEKFLKTWNVKYVSIVTPLLLLFSIFGITKILRSQNGGSIVYQVITIVSLGFFVSFTNDYAILNLFQQMDNQNCPCERKHRRNLTILTYIKIVFNVFLYLNTLNRLNPRNFDKLVKEIKKRNKN